METLYQLVLTRCVACVTQLERARASLGAMQEEMDLLRAKMRTLENAGAGLPNLGVPDFNPTGADFMSF